MSGVCVAFLRYKSWSYHTGDPSDRRMIAAATKRGVNLTSRSRPLTAEDMQNFDYILGMDFENIAAIQVAADHWASKGKNIPKDYRSKVDVHKLVTSVQWVLKGNGCGQARHYIWVLVAAGAIDVQVP